MRKKCMILGVVSFVLALAIFVWTFYLYHYLSPEGVFTPMVREAPGKPFITYLFGIWGVTFLFASVMSVLIGLIFYPKEK